MQTLEARRHTTRLGVVFVAGAVLMTAFTLAAIAAGERAPWWLVLATAVEALTGIGLMRGNRLAAGFAGLQLGALAVGAVIATAPELVDAGATASWLDLGNAAASMVITSWLATMAVVGLVAPQRRTTAITARVLGACLAVIAASHLALARTVGFDAPLGAVSIRLAWDGTSVWGFPGWPLWHAALAATALAMTVAPRTMVRRACSALFVLLALLVVLSLVSLLGGGLAGPASVVLLLIWSTLLAPLYLTWWLTDNLS